MPKPCRSDAVALSVGCQHSQPSLAKSRMSVQKQFPRRDRFSIRSWLYNTWLTAPMQFRTRPPSQRPPSQLVRVVLRCFPSWPTPCSANSYFLNTAPVPGHQRDQGSETIGPPCRLDGHRAVSHMWITQHEQGHRAAVLSVDHARVGGPSSRQCGWDARAGPSSRECSRAIEPVLRMGSSLVIEPGVFSAPPPVLSLLASPRPRALGVEGSPKSTPRRRPRASFLPPPPFSPFSPRPASARVCAARPRAGAYQR